MRRGCRQVPIHLTCASNKNNIAFLSVNYIGAGSITPPEIQGEAHMRLTLAAATVAIAALVAAPAMAEHVQGGPTKQGSQCWKGSKGWDGGTFGSWGACAAPASTATATRRARHS
jgi:hypothetical protein